MAAHAPPVKVAADFLVPRTAAFAARLKALLAESAALNANEPKPFDGFPVAHGIRLSESELGDLRTVLGPELLRKGFILEELTSAGPASTGALQVMVEPRVATLAERADFADMTATEVAARLIADDIQSRPLLFRPDDRPLSLRPMSLWERWIGETAQVQTQANYLTGLDPKEVFASLRELLPKTISEGEGGLTVQGRMNKVFFLPESVLSAAVKQEQSPLG